MIYASVVLLQIERRSPARDCDDHCRPSRRVVGRSYARDEMSAIID